ncbi:MAG TPA: DNA cytosine methyltransferase [Bryobacteraceae bacterium]
MSFTLLLREGASLPQPTFLEFFAGAGLVRHGLGPTWRCLWANDIDASKERIYTANFGNGEFHRGDVAHVQAVSLPSADMAWASFPCQDLSLAGWRRGMSARRSGTFWAFWRLMRDAFDSGRRPPILAIENVTGLLYGDNFAGLCEALAALEMKFGAMVLDARWFLPQSRPRVFVVAVDENVNCESLLQRRPAGLHLPKALVAAHSRLSDAVKDRWLWWSFAPPRQKPVAVENLIDLEPSGVVWNSVAETNRLIGMMTGVNRAKVSKAAQAGEFRVGFVYKRMREGQQRAEVRFDGVAGCLRTPGGGSSRQTILVVCGEQIRSRLLSAREAARLMGLGDDFRLPGTYNESYRAMGDGVASGVVTALSEQLLRPLARAAATPRAPASHGLHEPADQAEFRARAESRAASWVGGPEIK